MVDVLGIQALVLKTLYRNEIYKDYFECWVEMKLIVL